MFDPSVVSDVSQTVTTVPWVDKVLTIIGGLTLILTAITNMLPKFSPITLVLAKLFADFRGVVPKAAAKAEAEAQLQGMTTVPENIVASGLPLVTKESMKPPPQPPQPPQSPTP